MNVLQRYKHRNNDFKNGYDKGFADGVNIAIQVILFAVVQFLGDKRGWKRERIFDCLLWLHKHATMISEEYTTFPEVVEAVKDEYGIIYEDGSFVLLPESEWCRK